MGSVGTGVDLTGRSFGDWLVLHEEAQTSYGARRWLCRCACGVERVVFYTALMSGKSSRCRSCAAKIGAGPALAARLKTHGMCGTPEHAAWHGMVGRCTNEEDKDYPRYGGRGITICPEWLGPEGCVRFARHVGPPPGKGYTIDRRDNSRGYEPGNVRWATAVEQARNRRSNHILEFEGEQLSVAAWAERLGMTYETLAGRLHLGWSVEDALTRPVRPRRKPT